MLRRRYSQTWLSGQPSVSLLRRLLLLSAILRFTKLVSANCYTPNGTDRNAMVNVADRVQYAPCDNYAKVSMCCAIGPGRSDPDVCQPGGYCLSSGAYWRESCTDPTWQDPACIKLFVNGTGFDHTTPIYSLDGNGIEQALSDVVITPCGGEVESFCYGSGEAAVLCCTAGQGFYIVDGQQTLQKPTIANNTTTSNSTSPSSSTGTSSSSSSLSTGSSIGIGFAAGVGSALVLAAVGITLLRRSRGRRRRRRPQFGGGNEAPLPMLPPKTALYDSRGQLLSDGHSEPGELGSLPYAGSELGGPLPAELESSTKQTPSLR